MNKQQLNDAVAEASGVSKADTARVLDALASVATEDLGLGNEVTLWGFGKFSVVDKAARQGRNPQTGEAITIAARRSVKFAPSSTLKTAIN